MGYSSQTRRKECSILQMDLQDKTCSWRNIEKYKARFVARGFSQKEGIDYEETFAPITRYTSIRAIMALASMMKWDLHQMDVKTSFLNGVIEEVYIEQPQGFEVEDICTHVCKLKKALYGLKQAPWTWDWETDCRMQEEARWRIWDERPWPNALFPKSESMAELRRNLSQSGKVCSGNFEKIWYALEEIWGLKWAL